MVTTIQLNENVKRSLDRLKTKKETYEEVILHLMRTVEDLNKKQEKSLIEGCKVMAEENLRITKNFELNHLTCCPYLYLFRETPEFVKNIDKKGA